MDDAAFVRGGERAPSWRAIGGTSSTGTGPFAIRSASVGPSTSSSTSADAAHRPVEVLEPVDLRDERMIERREQLGFAIEPRQASGSVVNGTRAP